MRESSTKFRPKDSVAKSTAVVFVTTCIGLGLNYTLGIFIARWVGIDLFGVYALGLYTFIVLATIGVAGLDSAVLRFVPRANLANNRNEADSVIKGVIFIGVGSSLLLFLSLVGTTEFIAAEYFNDNRLVPVFKGFALAIPAQVSLTILLSILQAHHDAKFRMLIKYLAEPMLRFGISGVLVFVGMSLDGIIVGYVAGSWLTLIIAIVVIRRFGITFNSKGGSAPWKEIITFSFPLFLGGIFTVLASRSDMLILGHFVATKDVGLYAAAFQTAAMISIVLQSIESVIAPILSEKLAAGDMDEVVIVYRSALRWVLNLGIPVFVSFIVLSHDLLGLYGSEFTAGIQVFYLLTIAQILNLATGSANYVLILSGRSKLIMMNGIVNAITFVGSNLILIPLYGILGAAIAMVFALSTLNILRLLEVYYIYKIHPYRTNLAKPLFAGLFIAIAFFWIQGYLTGPARLLLFPLIVLAYFVLLWTFGIEAEDEQSVQRILNKLRGMRSK